MGNKLNKQLEETMINWELVDWVIDNNDQLKRISEVCKWHAVDLKGCADILERIAPLVDIFTPEGFILRCNKRFPGCGSWGNKDEVHQQ